MQLNPSCAGSGGQFTAALALLTAGLLGTSAAAQDQTSAAPPAASGTPGLMEETAPGPGSFLVEGSVLFYHENGSRVQAIEPVLHVVDNLPSGTVISGTLTYDALTGATPNGALPAAAAQTFTSIIKVQTSEEMTTTGASGGSTVTTIPGTNYARSSYTVAARTLPLGSFQDHRYAGNLGLSWLADADTRFSASVAASVERDFTTGSGSLGVAHDFNDKNTTLSLTGTIEYDLSRPFNGTASPFQSLATPINGGNDTRLIYGALVGVAQTISRGWITQLNYTLTANSGYNSDPYRVLSLLSATEGTPVDYLYENRPRTRTRHGVYWGNKLAIGPTVADLSARWYHDTWGITSLTFEASEQIPLGKAVYIKPTARFYHQSAASFFRYYLVDGGRLPDYASSDSRLGRFDATTFGARLGVRVLRHGEWYLNAEDYRQTGAHTITGGPASLSGLDVFSGVHALSVTSGFRVVM